MHTETFDLSVGGGAIRTEYEDLTGAVITLLIAQPPRQAGEQPRMLKVPARVVSTVKTRDQQGFRHGLAFLRSPGDGLDSLEDLLRQAAPEVMAAPARVTAAPADPAPPAAPAGRLAALKQAAQAKLAQGESAAQADPRDERDQKVDEALQRAFDYFKELAPQLDVLKPAFAHGGYAIPGVPEFAGLAWQSSQVDQRMLEVRPGRKLCSRVILEFKLAGPGGNLKVERQSPASDRLRQYLADFGIKFSANDTRNDRGVTVKTMFGFPCQVAATLELEAQYDQGRLLLKTKNVERFGIVQHVIAPEAVTQASLEELTGFLLAETNKVGPLLLAGA